MRFIQKFGVIPSLDIACNTISFMIDYICNIQFTCNIYTDQIKYLFVPSYRLMAVLHENPGLPPFLLNVVQTPKVGMMNMFMIFMIFRSRENQ